MTRPYALIHCNAGSHYGMGHFMRSLALIDELEARGWSVSLGGDLDRQAQDYAARHYPRLVTTSVEPRSLGEWFEAEARSNPPHVIHIDSYWEVPDLRGYGAVISNIQDGPYGVRATNLAIDPNLGAERWFEKPALSSCQLIGGEAAVIRRQVLDQRARETHRNALPKVLVVIGGTDPARLTHTVLNGLLRIITPIEITVVAPPEQHEDLRRISDGTHHDIAVERFIDDLPAVAREQDLIVSAAGTSVWDFACMGVPMALVCAVSNQTRGYRAVTSAGLAHPLGEPPHEKLAENIALLADQIFDHAGSERHRERLRSTIDGLGTWRIVSAWNQLITDGVPVPQSATEVTARAAVQEDARMLLDWRNDPVTRKNSQSHEEVRWEDHRMWLRGVLGDPDRKLLVMEAGKQAVGTARWDRVSDSAWEVSITIAPEHRGRKLARPVLLAAESSLEPHAPVRLSAWIHQDNIASHRLFADAGYLPHLPTGADGFGECSKWKLREDPR